MGSAGSRMGGEVERLPAKILPLLRRRYEEITRRKSTRLPHWGGSTPSKKVLLNGGDSAGHSESSASHRPEKERTTMQEKAGPLAKANVKPTAESLAKEEAHESKGKLDCVEKRDKGNESRGEEERNRREENEKGAKEEGEGEEEERMKENEEENRLWPASPSFRIYYIDSLDDNKDDDGKTDSFNTQTDEGHENDPSKDSKDSSEGSETKRAKKHKKGRRFRRVLPKGRPVKKLLNVRSCYYPSCSSHDRARLLTKKSIH